MFKFLVDHNVPKSVSVFLLKKKYNVKLVKDIDAEMSDEDIVKLAIKDDLIIISNDKDFIYLGVKYPKANMILFSYSDQSSEILIDGISQILPKVEKPFGTLVLR